MSSSNHLVKICAQLHKAQQELKDLKRENSECIYSLCYDDVYDIAEQNDIDPASITEEEMHIIRKGVESGLDWSAVISCAMDEIISARKE